MIKYFISLGAITIIDKFFSIKSARWFSLHAIINLIVSISSFSSVVNCFRDPVNLNLTDYSYDSSILSIMNGWSSAFILTLHIYHSLFFKITADDIMHHLIFVPFSLINLPNNIKNICTFFVCGFPGMLTYIALTLKKLYKISCLTEKKISVFQNLFIRAPGLLFYSFSLFYSYIYAEKSTVTFPMICLICFLSSFNGLYYLQQIIGSYYLKINDNKLK